MKNKHFYTDVENKIIRLFPTDIVAKCGRDLVDAEVGLIDLHSVPDVVFQNLKSKKIKPSVKRPELLYCKLPVFPHTDSFAESNEVFLNFCLFIQAGGQWYYGEEGQKEIKLEPGTAFVTDPHKQHWVTPASQQPIDNLAKNALFITWSISRRSANKIMNDFEKQIRGI